MATIAQNNAQMEALDRVNDLLNEVKLLNDLLGANEQYTIRIGRKTSALIDKKFNGKIAAVLMAQRKARVGEINTTVAKFKLALSEKEEAMLSDQAVSKPAAKQTDADEEPYYGDEDDVDAVYSPDHT